MKLKHWSHIFHVIVHSVQHIIQIKIVTTMYSISTNVTITVSPKVMSTMSINFDNTTVRYKMNCYILHMFYWLDYYL